MRVRQTSRRRSGLAASMAMLFLGAIASGLFLLCFASPASALNTAVFSNPTPASGAAIVLNPSWLSVSAVDSAPITSATMRINGVAAAVSIDRPNGYFAWDEDAESNVWVGGDMRIAKLMSYNPGTMLLPGANTVIATVTSSLGTSTYTWTFNYGSATTVGAVSPSAGAILPASPAAITASLVSPSSAFTTTMTVDGVVVPITYSAATKTYTHTPATTLAAGMHTVILSAVDAQGGKATKTWSFKVATPMSNADECMACHTTFPAAHPIRGCEKCHSHGYQVSGGAHGKLVPTAAGCVGDGGGQQDDACHSLDHSSDPQWGVWGSGPFTCTDCHSLGNPSVPRHTEASTTVSHATPAGANRAPSTTNDCTSCHSSSLIAEHSKYPKAAAVKYQCDLCHGPGVRQQVKDAVAARNTACSACHGTDPHPLANHPGGTDAAVRVSSRATGTERGCSDTFPSQVGCHSISNLGSLHLEAPGSCSICHGPGKTPTFECLTCHPTNSSGGGEATGTTLAAASWYHHNNVKYLIDPADATPNPYYTPVEPPHGWLDTAWYNDCYSSCHADKYGAEFKAYNGQRMWFSGPGGYGWYGPSVRTLTSAATQLPSAAYLDFMTYYNLTDVSWGVGSGVVQLSADGGATWETLTGTLGGVSRSAIAGASGGWIPAHYDLSPYAGQTVLLRFRFDDGSGSSTGWALDDLVIGGAGGPIFTDGAETLLPEWTSSYWIRSYAGVSL